MTALSEQERELRGAKCDVFNAHGVHLGAFKTIKAARAAADMSRSSSCVCDNSARTDNSG